MIQSPRDCLRAQENLHVRIYPTYMYNSICITTKSPLNIKSSMLAGIKVQAGAEVAVKKSNGAIRMLAVTSHWQIPVAMMYGGSFSARCLMTTTSLLTTVKGAGPLATRAASMALDWSQSWRGFRQDFWDRHYHLSGSLGCTLLLFLVLDVS